MLSSQGRIGLIAIDEAHLILTGQHFVPNTVESIKKDFTNVAIMALTTIAPPEILLKLRGILKEP